MRKTYVDEDYDQEVRQEKVVEEFGCGFCWNKKKEKDKELFFLDNANNMRLCLFCPNCGRAYKGENR